MSVAKQLFEDAQSRNALFAFMWRATDAILQIYRTEDFRVRVKADNSPVTKADLAAHEIIASALSEITPTIPLVSEEDSSSLHIPQQHKTFWLVDPLDGTREFIKRSGEFTCNLALIENHQPTLGLVSVPTQQLLYVGGKELGASRTTAAGSASAICCSPQSAVTRVVVSVNHLNEATQAFVDAIKTEVQLVKAGSSLKFLHLAEGKADLYPRLAPTCEWDTAAAQAVLEGAGGSVMQIDGLPMQYGKSQTLNPHFVARAYQC